MSPAARKFEYALNLPTITSGQLVLERFNVDNLIVEMRPIEVMNIVHNVKISVNLLQDWMEFTNALGSGILSKIS